METKQHATKNQWINEDIKEEIRRNLKKTENKNTTFQIYGTQQRQESL